MYFAGITQKRNIADLPSWVPDFSRDISINPFGIPDRGEKHYASGGPCASDVMSDVRFEGRHLIARGVITDTIRVFGHVRIAAAQDLQETTHRTWRDWAIEAIDLVSAQENFSTCPWKTPVADATQLTKDLAPSRYEQSFQSFKDVYLSALYTGLDWREAHTLVVSDHNIQMRPRVGQLSIYSRP